jgi:hypothetical protein
MKKLSECFENVESFVKRWSGENSYEELVKKRKLEAERYLCEKFPGIDHDTVRYQDILRAKAQQDCPDTGCIRVKRCPWSGWITQIVEVRRDRGGYPVEPHCGVIHYYCPVWVEYHQKVKGWKAPKSEPEEREAFLRKDLDG